MDRNVAEKLAADLERHTPLTPNLLPNKNYFLDLLISTDMSVSRRFYEEVAPNQVFIPDNATSQHHSLSIRRVLRNNQARDYQLSRLKGLYEAASAALGIRDSDILTRRLRMDGSLARLMAEAALHGQPYSLLAKLETFDELSRKMVTRPLVIIPDSAPERVSSWENANTVYGRDTSHGMVKIRKGQYLKP